MKKTMFITAIIYILLGIFMIISPASISNIICYVIGFLILAFGGNQIFIFINSKGTQISKFNLVLGILALLLGSYVVINPEAFISFIPIVVGVIIIVDAITKMVEAFSLKNNGYAKWNNIFITSIIMLLFGLFLFFNPFDSVKLIFRLIGIFLVIDGINQFITANAMKETVIEAKIVK